MLSEIERDELLHLAANYVAALKEDALSPRGKSDHLFREMLSGYGNAETALAIDQMMKADRLLNPDAEMPVQWHVGVAVKAQTNVIGKPQP